MPDGELGVSDFGISVGGGARSVGDVSGDVGEGTEGTEGKEKGASQGSEKSRAATQDARFEMADQIRRITSAMVGIPITDTDIAAATASLREVADGLERTAGPGRRLRAQPDPVGHPQEFFPTSPVIGFANPVAPPVVVEAVDGELRGTAYFDYQYEGPPTCVHGGVLAMVFDEMLGAANIMAGSPGMTGTLTIRYRKPTPLRTPLRLEARFMGQEGRKIRTYGAIFHGETLTAEAEGIFIELIPQRFLAIVTENSDSPEAVEQVRADARRLGFTDSGSP